MKILLITSIFPPDIGGPAGYVFNLFNSLRQLNHNANVIAYGKDVSRKYPLPLRMLLFLFLILKEGRKYDLFYAHGGISSTLPALLAGKLLRKKIGVKVTGDYAWEQSTNLRLVTDDIDVFQIKKYGFFIKILKLLQNFVVGNSNFIVVPSQYLKKMVSGWGAREERIYVIYNSVVINDFPDIPKDESQYILSVGRLVFWKGFDILIDVFSEICGDFTNLKLVIVGDGPLLSNLNELAKKTLCSNNILFTGALNKKDVFRWYAKSSCFVLFSGYEGLSHVLLEALSFGLPVIASKKGGNVELIDNGVNGILVDWPNKSDLKNALLYFLKNPGNFISNPGLIDKDRFSWNRMINETISVLKNYEKK